MNSNFKLSQQESGESQSENEGEERSKTISP